jgi:hypothetical protein
MDKAIFQNIVSIFKEVGIKSYNIYSDGDNNRLVNNETSVIVDKGDKLVIFSLTDNVGKLTPNAMYDVTIIQYDKIVTVKAIGMTMEQGLEVANKLGIDSDEDFKTMVNSRRHRQSNNPGTGGQLKSYTKEVVDTDDEGNEVTKTVPVVPKGMSHYVV